MRAKVLDELTKHWKRVSAGGTWGTRFFFGGQAMTLGNPEHVGKLLAQCTAKSKGAYVLIRLGQRYDKHTASLHAEYRVNVRTSLGGELTTTSASSLELALQRAVTRLTA